MDFYANQKKPVEPIFGGGKKENNLSRKTNKTSFGKRLKIKDGLTMQVANGNFFFRNKNFLYSLISVLDAVKAIVPNKYISTRSSSAFRSKIV